jgi:tetratricopeptide (TPR) repeat protein
LKYGNKIFLQIILCWLLLIITSVWCITTRDSTRKYFHLTQKKHLKSTKKTLSADHPDLSTSYSNIGLLYECIEEHSEALLILPANHLDFGQSYNNIAGVYLKMEEYSKLPTCFVRALKILESSLLSN